MAFILGPPLGSLPIGVSLAVVSLSSSPDSIGDALKLILASAVFGYILGGLAALVGGLSAAVTVWNTGTLTYRRAALLGLSAGAADGFVMFLISSDRLGDKPLGTLGLTLSLMILSLWSALACRFLISRLGGIPASPATAPPPDGSAP